MYHFIIRFLSVFFLIPVLLLTGCDSGGSSDDGGAEPAVEDEEPGEELTLTGEWSGSFGTGATFSFSIVQDGEALTGQYTSPSGTEGTLTGNITGDTVTLTTTTSVEGGSATAQWTATVNAERTSMGGSFTIVSGGGGNGTFTATRS